MSAEQLPFITPDEYLEIERSAATRSEYFAGQIFAMSGGSQEHNFIAGNLYAELRAGLRGRPCKPFVENMRLKVQANGLYTYPDVMVVCGEVQLEDNRRDTVLNPVLIAEVLSKSTEAYDRGDKFDLYRGLDSLREYLLVSQDRAHVVVYSRQPDGESWLFRTVSGIENTLRLDSIDCEVPLSEIYYMVDLPPASAPARSSVPEQHGGA